MIDRVARVAGRVTCLVAILYFGGHVAIAQPTLQAMVATILAVIVLAVVVDDLAFRR